MTFTISFNGQNISDVVDGFTSIERNFGSTWTNNLGPGGTTRYGQEFVNNYSNAKTITISFIKYGIPKDWVNIRQQIASVLDVSTPSPLIFSDEPNKVWYALPDQLPTFSEDISSLRATGTLTFIVPSGVAISSYTQELNSNNSGGTNGSITVNSDNSVDVLINNQGTIPAYPTFKFTHKSDNAFIGIAGQNGVVGLGSQDQTLIDSKTTETTRVESQWLLNPSGISQNSNFSGHFNVANDVGNPQNGQLLTAGNLVFKKDGLRLQDGGPAPSGGTWSMQGAMQVYNVPADRIGNVGTANFTSTFNIWAQATKMGQTGLMQVLFCDSNNKLMAGLGIYKDDTRGNSFRTQLYIGGNHPRTWKTFGPGGQELNNGGHGDGKVHNPNLYFNSTTGYFTIQKKDRVFNFTFGNRGGNYPITIPELGSTKCTKVFVYMGQLKGRDVNAQYITNLSLRMFNFQKNDVTKTIDSNTDVTTFIPADNHHYGNSEVVVVNMSSSKIYRREGLTIANDEMITGSEPFSVPPGQSIVNCSFGDNTVPPDIDVTWKERYL
ncbi:MAG: phage tail family protein [Lactococcus lactis]|nr:phage tail family protein [Lactobacillus sp.]MDN6076319.1 phage tail family protein [Lactococcus lactis]MDN6078491.1 phage tail family protein [Lactococcus lactis]MDN6094518.1 phage tail family protein [Lactococcus lactis]